MSQHRHNIGDILTTKLLSPRLPVSLVSRPDLLKRVAGSFERKLTLICAPAGFGKTTLVSEWAAQTKQPITWLSLDEGDNDPLRFWRYIIAACQHFHQEIDVAALEYLFQTHQPGYTAMLTGLINDIASLPDHYGLILEDYHVVISDEIHRGLAFLLEHLPRNLHLIIMTRSEPPLPLARLRVLGELDELGADDLRFSHQEVKAFLHQNVPIALSNTVIKRLEYRIEGWAAGLRLATLSIQNKRDIQTVEQFLKSFNGSHQHVAEYLISEVFSAQPAFIQEFLMQTAFLNRLSGDLCDAVTGRDDSTHLLEALKIANLFLLPLEGTWYRYHTLFAEALQHYAGRSLGEVSLKKRCKHASQWYEAHGLLSEAVEVALLAQDFEQAAALINTIIKPLYQGGNEYHTLRRWIGRLPSEVRNNYPTITLTYVAALIFTSPRRAPETWTAIHEPLQSAETYWRTVNDGYKLGEVLVFRSLVEWWQGNFVESFVAIRQALELLPEDDIAWRGICLVGVGLEEIQAGHLEAALSTVLEAQRYCEAFGNYHALYMALYTLGDIYYRRGELHQAEQYYQRLLTEIGTDEGFLDYRAQGLIGLGTLAYEWNDLDSAEQQLREGIELDRSLNFHLDETIRGSLILARLLYLRGDSSQAQQLLSSLIAELRHPRLVREVRVQQGWLALITGDVTMAQHWCTRLHQASNDALPIQQEKEVLLTARILIAQHQADSALQLLDHWQADAHYHKRTRSELEIIILKALAFQEQGNKQKAQRKMMQALEMAHTEGYRRLFLDEGEPMIVLLREVLPRLHNESFASYARSLLMSFSVDQVRLGITTLTEVSIKPLSPQEEQVLQLLMAGLSKPEIAQQLVVSINTVKTHVKNIYRKLNVSNRDEAIDVIRQLKFRS